MKHWFTIDDFIVAFIAAVGYGFGYSVPDACGLPGWLCFVICYAVGFPVKMVAEKIIFSKSSSLGLIYCPAFTRFQFPLSLIYPFSLPKLAAIYLFSVPTVHYLPDFTSQIRSYGCCLERKIYAKHTVKQLFTRF